MTEDAAPPAPARRRLIYIGGYGRSGSTLLGRVMAERRNVLYLGEVVRAGGRLRHPKKQVFCTCGRQLTHCPVWRNVPAVRDPRAWRNVDRRTHLAMIEAVMASTDHPVVVDSSKTARRHALVPGYVKHRLDADFTMIHLVRDPRGVVWSVLRDRVRNNRPPSFWAEFGQTLKVAAGWSMANIAAELFGLRNRSSYVRLRYEDAVRVGVPEALDSVVPDAPRGPRITRNTKRNHHAVAGNRMRHQKKLRIALDDDWRASLNRGLSVVVATLCFPLLLRYRFVGQAGEVR